MMRSQILSMGLCVLLLAPVSAQAASFDCDKAETEVERRICDDPWLSSRDEEMDRAYRAALPRLTPAGQSALRESQRQWRGFIRTFCGPDRRWNPNDRYDTLLQCLQDEYGERIAGLGEAVVEKNGLVLARVDLFAIQKVRPDVPGGTGRGLVTMINRLPRIDRPQTSATERWNAWIRKAFETRFDSREPADWDVSFEWGLVREDFVSVRFETWVQGPGTPHGYGWPRVVSTFVSPELRSLYPEKLFDSATAWRFFVLQRLTAELHRQDDSARQENRVAKQLPDPQHWLIGEEGVVLSADLHDVFEYGPSDFFLHLTLPWADLKPYLAAGIPFP